MINEMTIVKEYEFDKPLFHKINSIIDNCIRDCNNKCFHTFDLLFEYDIKLTDITIFETFNRTISDKSMKLYEIIDNMKIARQNGFIINQINNFTIKIYCNLSNKNLDYCLKHQIPLMHGQFFKILSQNPV